MLYNKTQFPTQKDIIWSGKSKFIRALFFNIWIYSLLITPLIYILYFSNEDFESTVKIIIHLVFWSVIVLFIIHMISYLMTDYLITKSGIVIYNNLLSKVTEIDRTSILKIELKKIENGLTDVYFYFKGVDIEGFQNRLIVFGVQNVEDIIDCLVESDGSNHIIMLKYQ